MSCPWHLFYVFNIFFYYFFVYHSTTYLKTHIPIYVRLYTYKLTEKHKKKMFIRISCCAQNMKRHRHNFLSLRWSYNVQIFCRHLHHNHFHNGIEIVKRLCCTNNVAHYRKQVYIENILKGIQYMLRSLIFPHTLFFFCYFIKF